MNLDVLPEEHPAVSVRLGQLSVSGRSARIRRASSVRRSVGAVVLVVRLKDGKGLFSYVSRDYQKKKDTICTLDAQKYIPETRVLCEHSAAWMALETFDAMYSREIS